MSISHFTSVLIVTSSFARIVVGALLKRGVTSEEARTISKRKEKDKERKEISAAEISETEIAFLDTYV